MIGKGKIIIDGFWNTDKFCGMSLYDCIIGKLFDRIHRVIPADIDKAFDLQLFKDSKYFFKYFRIFMDLRKLITAGAKVSRRCSL